MSKPINRLQIAFIIPAAAAALLSLLLFFYLTKDPTADWKPMAEGLDNQPANRNSGFVPRLGSYIQNISPAIRGAETEDWPGFLGERRFNRPVTSRTGDLSTLSNAQSLWTVELGEGHSGAAVADGLVYVLDYDEENQRDLLRCFNLLSGEEYWQTGYDIPLKRNHGISRTIPAVADGFIVTIGPDGQVMCVDAESGQFRWGTDLRSDWKSEIPLWYTAQCPLIDGETVVLAPAGEDVLLLGLELATGEELWRTPNPNGYKMSHSSVIITMLDGKRQYVYSAQGGISGISAEEQDRGTLLWQQDWDAAVVAPTPVPLPDNRLFQTAGYGAGSIIIRISGQNGQWATEVLKDYGPSEGTACEQQTPLMHNGRLISLSPKDAGIYRNRLTVSDTDGNINWYWDSPDKLGLGPYLATDSRLFILNDDGELFLFSLDGDKPAFLDRRIIIPNGVDAWAPLALTPGGVLLARDSRTLVALDLIGETQ